MTEQGQNVEMLPLPDDLDALDALEESQEQAAEDIFAPENRYTLTTQYDFERAMRQRARNLKIAAEIASPFDAEIAERQEKIAALVAELVGLQAVRNAGVKPWLGRANWYASLIEAYFRQRNADDPRIKSWPTPYGTPKLAKQQPEWRYEDEDETAKWLAAQGHSELTRVSIVLDKVAFKKAAKDAGCSLGTVILNGTGEVVPGVTLVERPPKFEIKD